MNDRNIAINIENISKCYRIGRKEGRHDSLAKTILGSIKRPFSNFKKYRSLYKFNDSDSDSDIIWSLRDVSFKVEKGAVVGIIGSNGAGKSTLLKILSRITNPTSGKAEICGNVASLLEVGTGFHPELTGRENVYLNGTILGMRKKEIDNKFDEIVDFSGVERFIDTPVKRYSSGMKVRLAFAVAAHLEPDILIIDEVLAVGDTEFQKKCIGKMENVSMDGRTVLFVSHNLAAVQMLCGHCVLLEKGAVAIDGSTDDVISFYLKKFTQSNSLKLSDRTDRKGKGDVRLIRVDIVNGKNWQSPSLYSGQPVRFVFHVNERRENLSCVFTLYDKYGQRIVAFNSNVNAANDFIDPEMTDKIICELEELFLVPGSYRINVAIDSCGELQDYVESAANFEVYPGDVSGRSIIWLKNARSTVCLPHRWILPK